MKLQKLGSSLVAGLSSLKQAYHSPRSVSVRSSQAWKTAFFALTILGLVASAFAQTGTDATVITTAATTAFIGVAGLCVSIGTFFIVYRLVKRIKLVLALLTLALAFAAAHVQAQTGTDATVITTAATTAFIGVAGLCVSIGTFFIVYRLVKRIK
jgi:hypothetical protein